MIKLRPWQLRSGYALADILHRHGSAVDLSDAGTGKTYTGCAVAASLKANALAVVPKISVSNWRTVGDQLGAPLEVIGYEALRTGRSNFGRWENQPPPAFRNEEFFVCESCQCVVDFDDYRPCYCHSAGLHCIKTKRKPWKYGKFIWDKAVQFVLFDEAHRCSGLDSLNADMLIAAKRQGIKVLMLSATAACTPLQMRALGFVLDLHGLNQNLPVRPKPEELISKSPLLVRPHLPTFYQWAGKYDCRPDPVYRGLKWAASTEKQVSIMASIHRAIIPARGVRVRTQDIPGFSERIITAELYDLEKDYEIEKLYREMAEPLASLSKRTAEDALCVTKILRARQRTELLVVPIFVELADDELAKGNSIAIFVNFRQTIDQLRLRLSGHNPGVVDGSPEGVRNRGEAIENFQSNKIRLLILNSAAGGVSISLHDTAGGHPRVGLISPGFSAVEFKQVCGRLHRDGAKSPAVYKVVLAANTIQEKIKRALDKKLSNLDALCDGDLIPV